MMNAIDALKMAFAVMVFAVALALTFSVISNAKSTADAVLFFNDKTNFRSNKVYIEDENGGKVVNTAEVISTINRCKTEKISVTVEENGDKIIFDKDDPNLKMKIYTFVKEHQQNKEYREYFSEVTYSGIYKTAEDGTQLTVTSGDSKIYITYTLK